MKNKVLINDNRLTPTMQRVRSGRTQLFREKNTNDRSFLSLENCDLSLEHDDKSMYAELIEDKWYWISGCAECNGNPRGYSSYIECEKHDVCSCCSISRKEIEGSVWGGQNGWVCKPCKEAKDREIRRAAFERLDGEEPDTSYTDEIICPHCGSEQGHDHESQDLECDVCEGEFSLEINYTPHYSTVVKGERITK